MSTEDTMPKGFDGRLFRRIVAHLIPYRRWVALAFLTVMVAAYLGPLRPMLVQVAIDRDIASGDLDGLFRMIGLMILVLAGESVLSFVNDYLTQWIGQRAIFDLRARVHRHLMRQPLAFFDRTPIGRLITRVTSDVESLSQVLSAGVITIIGDLTRIVFIAWFMFTLNWTLALVTIAVMPLMLWVTFWFKNKVEDAYRDTRKQVARLNSFLQEHVTGMRVVQMFNREREEMRRFREINDDHRQAHIRTIFYFALFWPAVDIIGSSAVGLVIWFGGMRAMDGAVSIGVLIAFIQYARQFFEPIRNLSDQFNVLQSGMAGAERIFALLDKDEAMPEPESPVDLGRPRGEIEFRDVWFAYTLPKAVSPEDAGRDGAAPENPEPEWVLRGVSFRALPGQSVAIVGATGAGKTTIINLLLRFHDIQKGSILVDGVDIRNLRLHDLRRHVGLVLQDVFLFSGSVEDNISLANPAITPERVRNAAREIGADRFIERLRDGYAQDVRERGVTLSHGQRQLLSFARALAYDPGILVLDEATSSVDTETEHVIQEALVRLLEGRTSIVIAHRLSTIQHAHQILVMHRGEVRESGTHQQLLAAGGMYRRLYELQYREQEAAA